ncbi:MAG: hypothetical protein ACFCD0_21675 [Gemmataceae bacterium]
MKCCIFLALVAGVHISLFSVSQPARCQPPEKQEGIVFLLEGVGGLDLLHVSGKVGLKWQAGLPHEIRQFRWSHGPGCFLMDLQDFRHLEKQSQQLARTILAIRRKTPNRPIYFVAHSGGTGLAIRAAELLPPNTIDRIVLLASALSPRRDLRGALRASRGGIISYYSSHDHLILYLGTMNFGTVDRYYEASAGYSGFIRPPNLPNQDELLYRQRLVQIPWNPDMIWHGHYGNHIGAVMPGFLASEVAKWLQPSHFPVLD